MRAIHDTEFPNSVDATQKLVDEQGAEYERLKVSNVTNATKRNGQKIGGVDRGPKLLTDVLDSCCVLHLFCQIAKFTVTGFISKNNRLQLALPSSGRQINIYY